MVIVLLGILSATVVPKIFDKNTFSERAFFDDTLNAIRYAQKLAVATHCDVQVSLSSNSYTLKRPASISTCGVSTSIFTLAVPRPGTGDSSYTGAESGVSLSAVNNSGGAALSSIVFYPLGDASVDATVTVASKTFQVVKNTGFVYAP